MKAEHILEAIRATAKEYENGSAHGVQVVVQALRGIVARAEREEAKDLERHIEEQKSLAAVSMRRS